VNRRPLLPTVACLLLAACAASPAAHHTDGIRSWVYQLTGYADGRLDAIAAAPQDAAVIDLARDGGDDYFTADEISSVRDTGKRVFAYFSMGTIEKYRPEYRAVSDADLKLNRWNDWPDENFVKYWRPDWWRLAVKPRVDAALRAGFDGVYLDVPNAYEEIDPDLVPGRSRHTLAREMVDQIVHISAYAKRENPDFEILPQNSPELRHFRGYTDAIDGLGVEDLFFTDTDRPCTADWCQENVDNARALREAGKLILAVDYASKSDNIAAACRKYATMGFAGYVTNVELDRIHSPCS
jgi:cysteinyl-tRNA synthetase